MKDKNNFDKEIYNLIDNMENLDELDFDFENIGEEENLSSKDMEKIREKTYKKIENQNIKKHKIKSLSRFIASIVLVALIGTTVVIAIANNLHKYEPSSGKIIKSETPIYTLSKPITKKVKDGEITLNSFILNPQEERFDAEEEGRNVNYEYIKREVRINGKDILEADYEEWNDMGSEWTLSIGRPCEYKEGDKVEYIVIIKDKLGKESKIDFQLKLSEATSIEEYNKNLPNATNNNVTISAMTKEENNTLYVDLIAISTKENMDFEVDSFGDYDFENNKVNIFLTDVNGKKVKAEGLEYYDGSKLKFNIENLQKPFTIEIKGLNVCSNDLKGEKVTLPVLEINEEKSINKLIDIEDKNNYLTKESCKVLIKSVKRVKGEEENNYKLTLDYPDNKNSSIKIKGVNVEPDLSFVDLIKGMISTYNPMNLSGSSQELSEDVTYKEITLEYSNKDKKENVKPKFEISGYEYIIEGHWKLIIK